MGFIKRDVSIGREIGFRVKIRWREICEGGDDASVKHQFQNLLSQLPASTPGNLPKTYALRKPRRCEAVHT